MSSWFPTSSDTNWPTTGMYWLCNTHTCTITLWLLFFIANHTLEALPGVLGNRGTRAFISGEQGNKGQILRGTGEQRQYLGTGNIRKQIFDFWGTGGQANLFQGNKGTGTPPLEGLTLSLEGPCKHCRILRKHLEAIGSFIAFIHLKS